MRSGSCSSAVAPGRASCEVAGGETTISQLGCASPAGQQAASAAGYTNRTTTNQLHATTATGTRPERVQSRVCARACDLHHDWSPSLVSAAYPRIFHVTSSRVAKFLRPAATQRHAHRTTTAYVDSRLQWHGVGAQIRVMAGDFGALISPSLFAYPPDTPARSHQRGRGSTAISSPTHARRMINVFLCFFAASPPLLLLVIPRILAPLAFLSSPRFPAFLFTPPWLAHLLLQRLPLRPLQPHQQQLPPRLLPPPHQRRHQPSRRARCWRCRCRCV